MLFFIYNTAKTRLLCKVAFFYYTIRLKNRLKMKSFRTMKQRNIIKEEEQSQQHVQKYKLKMLILMFQSIPVSIEH